MTNTNYSNESKRDILCIDVTPFFASVETIVRRGLHPLKPYIVVMSKPNQDGVIGEQLFYHAHGIDQRINAQKYSLLSNSFSKSQILDRDYIKQNEIEVVIREMADQVTARLKSHHAQVGVIRLTIHFSKEIIDKGFRQQLTIYPSSSSQKITETCLLLFRQQHKKNPFVS